MIIETYVVSEWNKEAFDKSLQFEAKRMQGLGLVVEVQFSAIYMPDRENTEFNALLIGRRA